MLVATWACVRTDDIQRVAPESLRLFSEGFFNENGSRTRQLVRESCMVRFLFLSGAMFH